MSGLSNSAVKRQLGHVIWYNSSCWCFLMHWRYIIFAQENPVTERLCELCYGVTRRSKNWYRSAHVGALDPLCTPNCACQTSLSFAELYITNTHKLACWCWQVVRDGLQKKKGSYSSVYKFLISFSHDAKQFTIQYIPFFCSFCNILTQYCPLWYLLFASSEPCTHIDG